jgi:fumarate hydratase subunit alpha
MERRSAAVRVIEASLLVETVRKLCLEACCSLPADVESALLAARDKEKEGGTARSVLDQLIENQRLAREKQRPICQDTGMAVVFADIGRNMHIDGDLKDAVNEGVRLAYTEGYLRKSVLDPVTRVNTGDNTPAVLHIRFVPGDKIRLTVAPKGFGSENMSRLFMLPPSAGVEGIIGGIVDAVRDAGASACPPLVVGVGLGGTMESCALLSKRQLLRPLGEPAAREDIAAIEREALRRLNDTGIGPMGLGGAVTALAVHAAAEPTHIAGLPVAVNIQCHACRHASAEV